jgi:hypothetical protein
MKNLSQNMRKILDTTVLYKTALKLTPLMKILEKIRSNQRGKSIKKERKQHMLTLIRALAFSQNLVAPVRAGAGIRFFTQNTKLFCPAFPSQSQTTNKVEP